MDKISIILPTYNEKGNITPLVKEIIKIFKKNRLNFEIIVVDDNSSDGTVQSLHSNFKNSSNIKIHVRKKEKGLATAINYGIKRSTGDLIGVMDTDFNHSPSLLPQMVKLTAKYDLIIGSRYIQGGGMEDKLREFLSKFYNLLFIKLLLGSPVFDNLSGYFVIRKNKLKLLKDKNIFYGYGDYFIRLIYYAKLVKCSFKEVPCYYKKRLYGQSKSNLLIMSLTYLKTILKCRFSL